MMVAGLGTRTRESPVNHGCEEKDEENRMENKRFCLGGNYYIKFVRERIVEMFDLL